LQRFATIDLPLPTGVPEQFQVVLPVAGENHTLSLVHRSLRSAAFQVMVQDERGLNQFDIGPARTYRGTVLGVEGSGVAVSLIDGGLKGLIDLGETGLFYVQPASDFDSNAPVSLHVVYNSADAITPPGVCGNDFYNLGVPEGVDPQGFGEGEGGIAGAQPNIAEIGFDADFEFFQKNGSNVNNTVNDIEAVMNGVEFIYDRDVNIGYEFTTFIVRTVSADPYTTTDMGDLLCEFRTTWNLVPENAIQRDVAQLYTGKTIAGSTIGLAWLGVLCNQSGNDCGGFGNLAYSSVESRYTTVMAFRQSLSAHELGHNWGATHCDPDPECHIMCSSNGGCDGIAGADLKFGVSEVAEINAGKNSVSCDQVGPLPLQPPFLDTVPNSSIDSTKWTFINGALTSQNATNEPSATRALQLDSSGAEAYDDDEIRSNVIELGGLGNVEMSYFTQHKGVESGETLTAQYWSTSGDWVTLNTIVSSGTDQNDFVLWTHVLPTNAKHDGFRMRFVADGNDTGDDWYIDDIRVQEPIVTPPANDECTGAILIGTGTTAFDTTGATNSPIAIPAGCDEGSGVTMAKDIWFTTVANCNGTLTVSTCGTVAFDTRLAAYSSACPGAGTPVVACDDNTAGCANNTSSMTFNVTSGSIYYIRLGGSITGGPGTLSVTCTPIVVPPANDECANATVIGTGSTAFDSTNATNSPNNLPAGCNEGAGVTVAKDVWFVHTATCTGTLTVSTCGTVGFDTRIAAYASPCPGAATPVVGCDDNTAGCANNTSTMSFSVTSGSTYYIRVGGASAGGPGTLNVTCTPIVLPPANDECTGAVFIGNGTFAFDSTDATASPTSLPAGCDEGAGTAMAKDLWYLYLAPCTGTVSVSTCGTAGFDTRLAAYGVCPIPSTPVVACDDNTAGCTNNTSSMSFTTNVNSLYYIRVGGATTGGAGSFTVSCTPSAPPCPADLDNDGQVSGSDLAVLLGAWGNPGGDLDGNGTTDGADLAALLGAWGPCP
jgi:Metallo-peptidase family M12/Reprolysin family propeptide